MHSLVRRFIKTAVGFLISGLLIGAWLMIRREFGASAISPYEISAHAHAIVVGFIMLMIMGVALWLFPRPSKSDACYRPLLADAAYWAVTLGTAARVLGELARAQSAIVAWRWVVLTGGLLQVAGIALFFATMWSRIRPVGSQVREANGERF